MRFINTVSGSSTDSSSKLRMKSPCARRTYDTNFTRCGFPFLSFWKVSIELCTEGKEQSRDKTSLYLNVWVLNSPKHNVISHCSHALSMTFDKNGPSFHRYILRSSRNASKKYRTKQLFLPPSFYYTTSFSFESPSCAPSPNSKRLSTAPQ